MSLKIICRTNLKNLRISHEKIDNIKQHINEYIGMVNNKKIKP